MLERILKYSLEIRRTIQKNEKEKVKFLVVPIVIYTGKRKWNVATNFSLEGIQVDISTPTLMKGDFSANACTDKVISVEMAANDVVIDMNISLEKI